MDHPHRWLRPPATLGIVIAAVLGTAFFVGLMVLLLRFLRQGSTSKVSRSVMRSYSLPIRNNGGDSGSFSFESRPHQKLLQFDLHFRPWGRSMEHSPASPRDRIVRFTYKELQKATQNFSMVIGKGAFGPVYKATLPSTAVVAVKALHTSSKQGEKEFLNEVMLLGRLHYRNLVNLVGYCSEGGHRLLVYDYMSNGSLATRLHDEHFETLWWEQRVAIAQDVAKGLQYLHDGAVPPVIHRDIKSSNVLLDTFMIAKVADFGLSKEADPDMPTSGIRGTYGYIDPEYISTNSLSYKSDVYSFGVLLFELITGIRPQEGLMEFLELVINAHKGREVWLQILDPRLKGNCVLKELEDMALIAAKCVEKEPRKRPRMQEVVEALLRLGPRTVSSRLDFLKSASSKRLMLQMAAGGIARGTVSRSTSLEGVVEAM